MKYILLSDIHFGHKGNSEEFNKQCLEFLDFVAQDTENKDIDGAIFLGDWFHTRNNVNVKTLQAGVEGLYKLGNIGRGNAYFLLGNHDLYLRNSREIYSIIIPEGDIGVQLITEPLMVDNILMCPWLVENESLTDLIHQYNPEYVCGHFEIPSFSLNKMTKFDGEYNPAEYAGPKRIISGHFHMRSEKNNITYLGNCFSHDFSDVNDWHNKGYAIWDTNNNQIQYYEWKDAPKYCTSKISQMNTIEFGSNMHIKLINDIGITPLKANELKEQLLKINQIVDCMIYPQEFDVESSAEDAQIESIDNIDDYIPKLILSMDIENIDTKELVRIYNELKE